MPTHVDLDFVIYTTPDGEIREWRYPATNDWTREQAIEEFIKVSCEMRLYSWGEDGQLDESTHTHPDPSDFTEGVFEVKRGCYTKSPFWGVCDLYGGHEGKHSNDENRTANHAFGYAPSTIDTCGNCGISKSTGCNCYVQKKTSYWVDRKGGGGRQLGW